MNKQIWKLPAAAGILMILCAAGICAYNIREDRKAGAYAAEALKHLRQQLPAVPAAAADTDTPANADAIAADSEIQPADDAQNSEQSEYCGIIAVPALGLELPVLREWNNENLKLAPCRYSGSAENGDLILAAHNYQTHFGRIYSLSEGDQIVFTALSGKEYRYAVSETEIIDGYQVGQMLDGADTLWDLTLFTCTLNSQSRVTVRAVRIPQEKQDMLS